MNIKKLSYGIKAPIEVNVVIEVSMNSDPVKYEFDKESGFLLVDRFMHTSMQYPYNYGFIPNTLSGDGDPVDVLLIANYPIVPGAVISVKPIGVLITEDEKGQDEKILSVPVTKIDPYFESIDSYENLPNIALKKIEHFFEHYKDLEKDKWVKVKGWKSKEIAYEIITLGIKNFDK